MPNISSIDLAIPAIDSPPVVRAPQPEVQPAAQPAPQPAPRVSPPKRTVRHVLTRKRGIIAAIVILIGVLAWRALRPAAVDVDLARATVGAMQVTVDADAVTRVRAHFTVAAPVGGLLERIPLVEGDSVRRGDVVAVVMAAPADPTTRRVADARLDVARAARAQAGARAAQTVSALDQAEREAGRVRALAAAGALADRDVERAALTTDGYRRDLDAARAQERLTAAELDQAIAAADAAAGAKGAATLVRAPSSGRVLRIPERSARVVAPGAPIMEIGDPSALEVAADVLSSDAASIRSGQAVALRGWGGSPLIGRVRLVEPSARTRISALGVEEQRLMVVIDVPGAPAALGDGYRLEASVAVWQGSRVLTIPAGALLRAGDHWQLFVAESGRAHRRDVTIGHIGGGSAEVLSGVRAGERVIVFPSDAVEDGVRVRAAQR